MCGICGIASTRGPVDPDRLRAMATTLFHRGPDSEGAHVDGPVGIAARRLAIIDLTGGDQPIANEDGSVVVVQNGEIYNYRELMRELERAGHRFRTHCDTEVLVHGYEQWGPELWERLRGMFAVAVWDARARRLDARARPLRHQAALLPRRRRRAVVRVGARRAAARARSTSTRSRRSSRSTSIPAPLSIFRDIRKLPPGSHADLARGRVDLDRFARTGPLPARHGEDEAELVEECRARLRDSVRAHLIADVPVGVLLSGGVDSGALAALAAEESPEAVRTFSIGFEEASFDELAGARAVAQRYGTIHRELVAAARRRAAAAGARGRVRRAVRRLVGAPDVPRLEARGRGRQGRALRRGRRRALRRLLHLRRRPARRAVRPARGVRTAARRAAADLDAQARASTTRRSGSRAPPHLPPLERHHGWKEIFAADARAELTGRHERLRPARRATASGSRRRRGTSS